MTTVFDTAKYIVDKLDEIDTWKLQKLVYYCQAWSLAWDEQPLFPERIEAWANGPVCPALYQQHKGRYAVGPATPIWNNADINNLTADQWMTIDSVLQDYGDKSGHWLRSLTHLEDPWNQARAGIPAMEPCENEITHEMMRLYYGSL